MKELNEMQKAPTLPLKPEARKAAINDTIVLCKKCGTENMYKHICSKCGSLN